MARPGGAAAGKQNAVFPNGAFHMLSLALQAKGGLPGD
jgi:hypothetical protein